MLSVTLCNLIGLRGGREKGLIECYLVASE